ncbi:unnamed protein product [Rhizophagus irregularis]|nr:unnamed protein product [Rhizophagus irregularis]
MKDKKDIFYSSVHGSVSTTLSRSLFNKTLNNLTRFSKNKAKVGLNISSFGRINLRHEKRFDMLPVWYIIII